MKKQPYIHDNRFINKSAAIFHAFMTNFGTRKKVDGLNKINLEKVKTEKQDLNILLHGSSANYHRSMYSTIKLLSRFGVDVISVGYDYKDQIKKSSKDIKKQIESLMNDTHVKKVNIIGLCLGGLVARYYAEKLEGKKNINKLVTIYAPIKPIPRYEIGVIINKIFGGKPKIYNQALEEIQDDHTVKDHLYIYGLRDMIIKPEYSTHHKAKHVSNEDGHLFISYNPKAILIATKFLKGEKILEERI